MQEVCKHRLTSSALAVWPIIAVAKNSAKKNFILPLLNRIVSFELTGIVLKAKARTVVPFLANRSDRVATGIRSEGNTITLGLITRFV
jgi:hypothetical protein